MKKILISLAIIAMASLSSCNENKRDSSTKERCMEFVAQVADTITMGNYDRHGSMQVNGSEYKYSYVFSASDSLPIVTTSAGNKYFDNMLELYISKGDETIFSKTFTKHSFRSFIPENIFNSIVLMGVNINYNKEDLHDNFYFVVCVGDPDDEEYYIPIDLTVRNNGTLDLKKFVDIEMNSINSEDLMEPSTEGGV